MTLNSQSTPVLNEDIIYNLLVHNNNIALPLSAHDDVSVRIIDPSLQRNDIRLQAVSGTVKDASSVQVSTLQILSNDVTYMKEVPATQMFLPPIGNHVRSAFLSCYQATVNSTADDAMQTVNIFLDDDVIYLNDMTSLILTVNSSRDVMSALIYNLQINVTACFEGKNNFLVMSN